MTEYPYLEYPSFLKSGLERDKQPQDNLIDYFKSKNIIAKEYPGWTFNYIESLSIKEINQIMDMINQRIKSQNDTAERARQEAEARALLREMQG